MATDELSTDTYRYRAADGSVRNRLRRPESPISDPYDGDQLSQADADEVVNFGQRQQIPIPVHVVLHRKLPGRMLEDDSVLAIHLV